FGLPDQAAAFPSSSRSRRSTHWRPSQSTGSSARATPGTRGCSRRSTCVSCSRRTVSSSSGTAARRSAGPSTHTSTLPAAPARPAKVRSRSRPRAKSPTPRRWAGICSAGERPQVVDRLAQLPALDLETGEGEVQAPLALGGQAEIGDAPVTARLLALNEPAVLCPAHELGDRALRELKPPRELGHRRLA